VSGIVALGARGRVEGFALAGVRVVAAGDPEAVRVAWTQLGEDVGVLLLTPAAHEALTDLLPSRPELLWTEIPD
jgi:vacuolar-type H+-ATPase subunit F/Vma7